MRYAITIQAGNNFNSVNTLIVEDGLAEGEVLEKSWRDGGEELVDIIRECGYTEQEAENIVEYRLYFIINCDDKDLSMSDDRVHFPTGKEYENWEEYRKEVYRKEK